MTTTSETLHDDARASEVEPAEEEPEERRIAAMLEHVAHVLPAQGPIQIFIHHNVLHAFEHLPFERAAVEAGEILGCQPYLSEERYRGALYSGRIRVDDIEAAVEADIGGERAFAAGPLGTRRQIRVALLAHGITAPGAHELRWLLAETDALTRFRDDLSRATRGSLLASAREVTATLSARSADERAAVRALWETCLAAVARLDDEPREGSALESALRHRDAILTATGVDSDELVHPLLIRFCAAFLDQGVSQWQMPERELGFHRRFLTLYGDGRAPPPDRWLGALPALLDEERRAGRDELASIAASLADLGVAAEGRERYLRATALALRGWAGITRQIEVRPDRVPVHAPPTSLASLLAVRLLIERVALRYVVATELGEGVALAALRARLARAPAEGERSLEQRAWPLFQLAQILAVDARRLSSLGADAVRTILDEIDDFSEVDRRRVLHLAYERRHRTHVLDALAARTMPLDGASQPTFQALFCLDEREESLRRHLEEVAPSCETFGIAGFFGVAMYYRGLTDARPAPRCPIVITPKHEVEEVATEAPDDVDRLQQRSRRALGELRRGVGVGSRTLVRGTILALTVGAIAALPLVLRVLFPRLSARLSRGGARVVGPPRDTRLAIERSGATPVLGIHAGFTKEEMAEIVRRQLEDIGLRRFAPLVLVVGHGSTSLNNPHRSAYDCGACGGNRGGANARAFATMANDAAVRALLASTGCAIPDDTWFVAGEHNSCDESVVWFDTERIPEQRRAGFDDARALVDEARTQNAHERCRRFEAVPLWFPPALALAHVEARAEDLAQTRPEYGHATNAVCVVGRRKRTRGLFLDRRAFLVSYDPTSDDDDGSVLARLLGAIVPVVAGINLEYYFSRVDPAGYGCATKLPHNITGLLGVMDGHASDLRTGLTLQMVEIHEPVRLVFVIEAKTALIAKVMERDSAFRRLVTNRWLQLAALDPDENRVYEHGAGGFSVHASEESVLPVVGASSDWYRGRRGHLSVAEVRGAS